jgi:hypothetical protein
MNRVLVAGVAAALLVGAAVSPANAWRGGGGGFHGGGFHGGGFRGGFHDHDRFRGPRFFGGFGLGLGLGAVGGALLYPPPVYYAPPPVYYYPPPPPGYFYGTDGRLYPL